MLDKTPEFFNACKDGKALKDTVQSYLPAWRYLNAEIPLDKEMAKNFTLDFLSRTKNKNAGKNHEFLMQDFLANMKISNLLQKIDLPTLVIHGDKDPIVFLRHGKAVADAISKSRFIMIKGMGHTFFNRTLEEKIANLVIEHISQIQKS